MSEPTEERLHDWVNVWKECTQCNYETHVCPACGSDLDHVSYDTLGNHHTIQWCRPDLFPHEVGPDCTWPDDACYWDHETNKLLDRMKELPRE